MAVCTVILTAVLLFAMTTAWYSNVAQSSSLVFNTSSWGFSGQIEVTNKAIQASPGVSGIVTFTINNDSDDSVLVDVTVLKSQFGEELQKRIFFYADTALQKNEEQMQRVYIDSTNSYTYTLSSREQVTVSEDYYNEVPICWEWVYDMLGYYVQGQLKEDESSVTVEKYLRPIEYDYNVATFADDSEGGSLLTVDGEKTVGEFLEEISLTDGYAGIIDTTTNYGGYYPVSVEDGSGVWAYLCNFSEIERGIEFDTEFVQKSEEERSFTATLNFSTQSMPSVTVSADSAQSLQDAITDDTVDIVKLEQDIELTSTLSLPAGDTTVIDMNGYTVSGTGSILITASSNANLSIRNGIIKGDGSSGQEAIRSVGAAVTLNEVVVSDVDSVVIVTDNVGECDSRIKIINSELTSKQTSVLVQGNGPVSEAKSQLIVENSEITSEGYIGISGQGSASGTKQFWGTDIQVINSTVSGKWAGIYHPQQNSTMTVSDRSNITGYTGIAVKGGAVTVIDSTVHGTGNSNEPAAASGGWTDTGDGIYVEATYPWAASVAIKGNSSISSDKRKAVELFTANNGGPGSIKIYDGTFTPNVSEYWVTQ